MTVTHYVDLLHIMCIQVTIRLQAAMKYWAWYMQWPRAD